MMNSGLVNNVMLTVNKEYMVRYLSQDDNACDVYFWDGMQLHVEECEDSDLGYFFTVMLANGHTRFFDELVLTSKFIIDCIGDTIANERIYNQAYKASSFYCDEVPF